MSRVYLDYNASTPIAPEVREAMQPLLEFHYANPSSVHWASAGTKPLLDKARQQVAALVNARADEIVFTSGGTEANNQALKGAYFSRDTERNHFVTTQVEHPSVLHPLHFLERLGAQVTYLPVDGAGRVDPRDVERALTARTLMVSVMHANNEVGAIQPLSEISAVTRSRGVMLHTDAAQSVGKIEVDVEELGVDLLSLAGHKLYAPKGVGALFIRRGVQLESLMHGGGHECGRRAGTESVLLAAALGAACQSAAAQPRSSGNRLRTLRDDLFEGMKTLFGSRLHWNGLPATTLPNTLNFSIEGINGADLLARLPEVAATTGSACHSGSKEVSPVLKAMRLPESRALGAVRFSLGRETTREDIEHVLAMLRSAAQERAT
jgi:cysteine desulfurase